jgi:Winged helix-turn-helix
VTTNGEKITLLAEIIRVSTKGATKAEISDELSLSSPQLEAYLHFLRARKLVVLLDRGDYFPSEKGLAYLALYDDALDLADVDPPQGFFSGRLQGAPGGIHWSRAELASRMKDIIER